MIDQDHIIDRAYADGLRDYLDRGGEAALSRAYEFGRRVAEHGAGALDLVLLHHRVLAEVLATRSGDHTRSVARAAEFFAEVLAPLEMTLRGYRQSNAALAKLNATLETRNGEIEQARTATEAANRELESFSYSVAHDLRAPLRGIDGFSEALLEDSAGRLNPECIAHLAHIRDSAKRMERIIEDLLMLSHVSRSEISRCRVDLSALAVATIARLRLADPERRVDVIIADGLRTSGDERLLAIALDNLLGNAWKFTNRRSGPRIEFSLIAGSPPTFCIKDNGAGFDPAHAHRLFGVFKRLHTQDEFEGTGIGLATVDRIIRRHGGRVWAESEVGLGATFYFSLGEA